MINMEKRKLIQGLIGSFIGGVLLFSCSSEEMIGDVDQEVKNEYVLISNMMYRKDIRLYLMCMQKIHTS